MARLAANQWAMWGDVFLPPLTTQLASELVFGAQDYLTLNSGGVMQRAATTTDLTQNITAFIDEDITLAKLVPPVAEDHWFITVTRIPQIGDIFTANLAFPTNAPKAGGSVNELMQADFSFVNRNPNIVRGEGTNTGGTLFYGTTTVSGVGTGSQFGSLAAGDTLYAYLGVIASSVTGTTPTLDVLVQRAAADSWGAPTTVVTFSQATASANTHQLDTGTTGAQAEEWYRVSYTLGGVDPSFKWFCGLGIQ